MQCACRYFVGFCWYNTLVLFRLRWSSGADVLRRRVFRVSERKAWWTSQKRWMDEYKQWMKEFQDDNQNQIARKEIKECKRLLLKVGRTSMKSGWCQKRWTLQQVMLMKYGWLQQGPPGRDTHPQHRKPNHYETFNVKLLLSLTPSVRVKFELSVKLLLHVKILCH